eukprot:scaffold36_cov193-Alexandrium_tamarense.AAC.10
MVRCLKAKYMNIQKKRYKQIQDTIERERERDELGKLKLSTSPTVAGVVGVVGAECGACEITNYHACRSDELLQPHS